MLKGSSTELEERRKEEFHILRCSQHNPSQKLLEWEGHKVDFQASEQRCTSIRDDDSWHPEAHVGRSSCSDSCWTFHGLMNHIKDRSEGGTRLGRKRLGTFTTVQPKSVSTVNEKYFHLESRGKSIVGVGVVRLWQPATMGVVFGCRNPYQNVLIWS